MPPVIPSATYRLQLTANFDFDAAAAIVPYLKALGITHLYTTSSTFSLDSYYLIERGQLAAALIYMIGSIVRSIGAR